MAEKSLTINAGVETIDKKTINAISVYKPVRTNSGVEIINKSIIDAVNVYKPIRVSAGYETVNISEISCRELETYKTEFYSALERFNANITGREIIKYELGLKDSHIIINIEDITARSILMKLFTDPAIERTTLNIILPNYKLLKKCVLSDIDLSPGETLIVDSNEYIILKNDVEVMRVHSGDWIDEIDRDTDTIGIVNVSGSGIISSSVEYVERYL